MPSFFQRVRDTIRNIAISFRERVSIPGIPSWEESMEDDLDRARDIIMGYIIAEQPYGEVEPEFEIVGKYETFYYGGTTVSQRVGHTPISEGWDTWQEREGSSLFLRFTNISEHIQAVLGNTVDERWPVTGNPLLVFWLGHPLRWPPIKGDPGPRVFPAVAKRRALPNAFPSRVVQLAQDELTQVVRRGIGDHIIEIIEHGGYSTR